MILAFVFCFCRTLNSERTQICMEYYVWIVFTLNLRKLFYISLLLLYVSALKQIPGCNWQMSECNPKKGRCGKGFQTATLTGSGCPSKTKKVRCKIPCREEVRGPITGLSPSEAGLRGEAVSSSVSTVNNNNRNRKNKGQWISIKWNHHKKSLRSCSAVGIE